LARAPYIRMLTYTTEPPPPAVTELAEPLRVCTSTRCVSPAHYENCPECFGFGVSRPLLPPTGPLIPITAREAEQRRRYGPAIDRTGRPVAIACPTCGSTVAGVPDHSG